MSKGANITGKMRRSYWGRIAAQYQKHLMVIPAIIFLFIFSYYPLQGYVLAFKKYKASQGIWGSHWIGFEHFRVFLSSSYLKVVLTNTLKISLLRVFIVFPMPIIFALLLNEIKSSKFVRTVQTISYLPHFVSWVIVAGMVYNMMAANGLINNFLGLFNPGREPTIFLANGKNFLPLVTFTTIWKELGWESIIYLAALTNVDPQLEEAAVIDGANRAQRMWYVSIPSILNTVMILFIMQLSRLLNTNFDQIYLLQNQAIIEQSETIDTYVYRVGLSQGMFDYGQAVNTFKAAISLILLGFANMASKKVTNYGLW